MGDEKLLREIGERINMRRKNLRLTQEQLAEKMDVSVQMISNLELGKKAIRPENLVKISDILNISTDYILHGTHSESELQNLTQKIKNLSTEDQDIIEKLVDSLLCKNNIIK